MNTTSMIDVVFLLMIYFMTTLNAKSISKEQMELPPQKGSQDQSEQALTINVDRSGRIIVAGDELTLPQLITLVSEQAGSDPAGLDAQVGENGIMLSGGERQRLAIARALLAAPPILLLDESTSSLDGVNERMMREAIDAVAAGRTLIVIAHRLSTVVDSDRIVVVEDGRVIGEGTHHELVETVPLYRELAEHQLLV